MIYNLRSKQIFKHVRQTPADAWIALGLVAEHSSQQSTWLKARLACVVKDVVRTMPNICDRSKAIVDRVWSFVDTRGPFTTYIVIWNTSLEVVLRIRFHSKSITFRFEDICFHCGKKNVKAKLYQLIERHPELKDLDLLYSSKNC